MYKFFVKYNDVWPFISLLCSLLGLSLLLLATTALVLGTWRMILMVVSFQLFGVCGYLLGVVLRKISYINYKGRSENV